MAALDQPKSTYSDTVNIQRVISDVISIIDPRDTPLLAALGGLDSARTKLKINPNGTKIEWLEDDLAPLTSTANDTTTIATNSTSFKVADASIFQDGHVIKIDSEYMIVSGATAASDTISVYSRSYGGTNATHASTSAIEIVGMARVEGDDADYGPLTSLNNPYNYSDIFQKALKITGTQKVMSLYGVSNEKDYQASKALPELMRLIEKSMFHGIRAAGDATNPRSAGGLGTFITTYNTASAGGAITKTTVDSVVESVYGYGGNPDLLVVNHAVARDLKDIIDTSSFVRLSYENEQIGMQPVRRIVTQYANLQIVASRFAPVATAYVLDSRKIGLYTLRPFAWKDLAVTGDSDKIEIVGEFSLAVANDKAHGKVTGITS